VRIVAKVDNRPDIGLHNLASPSQPQLNRIGSAGNEERRESIHGQLNLRLTRLLQNIHQ
jgi:hypothetical protein